MFAIFKCRTDRDQVTSGTPYFKQLVLWFLVCFLGQSVLLLFGTYTIAGQETNINYGQAMYFSYVTITTLGYGDIVPSRWWWGAIHFVTVLPLCYLLVELNRVGSNALLNFVNRVAALPVPVAVRLVTNS